ncbi:MAG TPA: immunoglobulin domain-containing protein, partial [Verrucomicrobiae bacterium]|nr:immunoglobulin domain-containing protein [Verrucomicrobiae bacterium]
NDYARPHPKVRRMDTTALQARTVTPNAGSGPGGYFAGADFRNAYVPGSTLDGTGQTVGLVQFDGYFDVDITNYENLLPGTPRITVQPVKLDSYDGTPTTNGNIEVSLDIEMAIAMATNLAKIVVFEGNPTNGFFIPNDVLNNMAASNTIKNLSCSWGWSGGPDSSTETIFQTMAAQGQSFFDASGDGDAFTTGQVDNSGFTGSPASSPNITQVGGTILTMNGSGASYSSETVWNRNNGDGSSGGISSSYPIPGWQQGVSMLANGGSTTQRNIPDVALTAENIYVQYGSNQIAVVGGTSCAAPLWAGFMALVNQQAAATGKPAPGFINPAIYEIANESTYNSDFHDTTTGNNTSTASPNAFFAAPNYDLCTGIGTPNGTNLINALLNPDQLVVAASGGFNAIETPNGSFNITTQTFFVTNAGPATLSWSLINTSAWLNVSTNGGTLAAGASSPVVVSLNTVASNLPAGPYAAAIWFSNMNSGVAHARLFSLVVPDPLLLLTASGFTAFGPQGGPLYPATQNIVFTNLSTLSQNWSLINTSAWLSVSTSSGSIAGGGSISVTVSTNAATMALASGVYNTSLVLSNQTSHLAQSGLVFSASIGQSVVQNGGFETGDNTGWPFTGTSGDDGIANSTAVAGMSPHTGSYYWVFGEVGALASISQNVPTVPGQLYLLSLWVDSVANPFSGHKTTPNEFQILWNGSTVLDKVNLGKVGWVNMQVVVTATGTNSAIQLAGRDDNYFLGLDDISMIPGSAPFIAGQPTNLVVLSGSNAVFSVLVSGSTNLTYQWRKNGTNIANGTGISGVTTTNLVLTGVTTNSAANYTLFITNIFGAVTSSVAALTVVVPPSVTGSLTNRAVECGGNLSYSLNIFGVPTPGIQWSLDGTPLSGATNSSFTLTNVHMPNHGVSVAVTNFYGTVTSNAVLTVVDTQAPVVTLLGATLLTNELGAAFVDLGATALDVCAGALTISTNGVVNINAVGTNVLTYRASDGNGNTNAVTRTVIVRDTAPPAITWSFTNLVLAAGTNCSVMMTNVTGTNFILATDLSLPLTISQTPTNGAVLSIGTNVVVIAISDTFSNTAFSTNRIIVQDQAAPVLVIQPQSRTNGIGTTASFNVAATACTPVTVLWFSNSIALTAQTNTTLTLSNVMLAMAGNYYAVATASGGSVTSSVAVLTIYNPPGIGSVDANFNGSFTLNLLGTPGYTYVLEALTNLSSPGGWLPVATNVLGTNGVWQFTDSQATNYLQQFYRLKQVP